MKLRSSAVLLVCVFHLALPVVAAPLGTALTYQGRLNDGSNSATGQYSLTGGFWALYAVQMPGAPLLTIVLTSTNTALIWWPSPSTGFTLQQNTNLNTTNWVAPPELVNDDGTNKFIVVNAPPGVRSHRLYRLFKP